MKVHRDAVKILVGAYRALFLDPLRGLLGICRDYVKKNTDSIEICWEYVGRYRGWTGIYICIYIYIQMNLFLYGFPGY